MPLAMRRCTGPSQRQAADMGAKKQPGRFTLQFNLEDPQQQAVSELLEQQGRRKAQFLTNAVLCYVQRPGLQRHDGGAPGNG